MKKTFLFVAGILMFTCYTTFAQPPVPANPAAGNPSNCTILGPGNTPIDQCPVGSTVFVTNFTGGTYNRGNNGNNFGPGAIWRFANIGTVGTATVNVEVTINSQFQAILANMDNNGATDQAGVSVSDFFAPRIQPDVALNNTDRRGYVQMTINFFQGINNYSTPISIMGLNMISYDADGSFESGGATSQAWFRETRVAQVYTAGNPFVLASGATELVAYNYTDGGLTWNGFAGGVYERTGLSRCAEVASSFRYNNSGRTSVTFRLGYDFKAGTNGYNIGIPSREYGIKFGCYTFPDQITLPVKLINFSASLKNNTTLISWETENETNFSHYEIERKSNSGSSFVTVASKDAIGANSRTAYMADDNLNGISDNTLYYRLKMVDNDGKFAYSNIVMVRKDQKTINGISISPNPVNNGQLPVLRFEAAARTSVEFRIIDMTGKVIIQQQNTVNEGVNSIPVNNIHLLQPGIYVLQLSNGDELSSMKFSVIR